MHASVNARSVRTTWLAARLRDAERRGTVLLPPPPPGQRPLARDALANVQIQRRLRLERRRGHRFSVSRPGHLIKGAGIGIRALFQKYLSAPTGQRYRAQRPASLQPRRTGDSVQPATDLAQDVNRLAEPGEVARQKTVRTPLPCFDQQVCFNRVGRHVTRNRAEHDELDNQLAAAGRRHSGKTPGAKPLDQLRPDISDGAVEPEIPGEDCLGQMQVISLPCGSRDRIDPGSIQPAVPSGSGFRGAGSRGVAGGEWGERGE